MKTFLILIFSALFLWGCATTIYVCDDGSQVNDLTECPGQDTPLADDEPSETTTKDPIVPATEPETVPEPEPEPDPEPEPVIRNIETDIQELFDEAKTAVKSYSYEFYGPGPYDEILTISIKGNKQKLVYRVPIDYNGLEFDTIYLDSSSQTGEGYCENIYKGPCVNPNFKFGAAYIDFQHRLPMDWIDEVVRAEEVSSEYIGNRNALKLDVTTESGAGLMWIDDFYGMPVKVIINGTEWEYRHTVFNSVTDEDMAHSYIKPRPSDGNE